MGEFFTATFQITSILLLNGILNSARHRIIHAQDCPLTKFDLPGSITTEIVCSSRSLSLSPRFCRTGLASLIWGWGPARDTKGSRRVIQSVTGRGEVVKLSVVSRSCSTVVGPSI